MRTESERSQAQYHFFHWHLAFPDVFHVPPTGQVAACFVRNSRLVITVIASSPRTRAFPRPHVSLDKRASRVEIMGPFRISVKFLATEVAH